MTNVITAVSVLRYATKGVFDSNTTANIIMEYKGK
jgi:hypothetical protein